MSERSYPVSLWWVGVFYGIAFAYFGFREWQDITASTSSTAAIGFLFLPVWAAIAALPFAGVGYAAGAVIRAALTRQRRHVMIASLAGILAIGFLAYVTIDQVDDAELANTITVIETLDAAGLETFLESHRFRTNKFALAAVALNPAASSETLDKIASMDDPALHEKFGGRRALMGKNRKGLAVMRLVVRNRNVSAETLTRLSRSPDTYVLGDVAMNKATPTEVIERLYRDRHGKRNSYLIEWGLAYNPAAPEAILRDLATNSRNEYTLRRLADSRSVPEDIRKLAKERLAKGGF